MSVSYGELLKKRALAFLESAEVSLERGHYDLVLFNVEQSLQLYLKYLLYRRLGDFPISSRYVPRTYDREIAERVLEFAKKAIEVFQCVESRR